MTGANPAAAIAIPAGVVNNPTRASRSSLLSHIALVVLRLRPALRANRAKDDDHAVVFELGWAASFSHAEGWHTRGATFAFEVTPIEGKLELEAGVTAIRSGRTTETSVNILFKKPWKWSKTVEFMAGVGPELIHATGPEHGTFGGLSVVADLMFWPKKNVGWYLESGFEAAFRRGETSRGFAMAAGLILGR